MTKENNIESNNIYKRKSFVPTKGVKIIPAVELFGKPIEEPLKGIDTGEWLDRIDFNKPINGERGIK